MKQNSSHYILFLNDTVGCQLCLPGLPPIPFWQSSLLQEHLDRKISEDRFSFSTLICSEPYLVGWKNCANGLTHDISISSPGR